MGHHSETERYKSIAEFNNAENSVEVLLVSTTISSQGLNLQESCNHMIIVEVPSTISLLLQTIGRIGRIGQKKESYVELLYLQNSFDDVVLARAIKQYVNTWAAETNLRHEFKDCVEALKLIGYELLRAKLGLPYLP